MAPPPRVAAGRRARLVAERPAWTMDPPLPAGPALVQPHQHGTQRLPLGLLAAGFRLPPLVLRRRLRLLPRLRRDRPAFLTRRGPPADRGVRAPLVHALPA